MEGKLIIFAAPSGSGKSTIINSIMADGGAEELDLHFSISATSRAPRGEEKNGVEYFFLTPEEFRQKIANDEFVEYEEVFIFDVDVNGAMNIKKLYGKRALSIFIQPPSIEELRDRLEKRATDAPEVIAQRVERAKYELEQAEHFDEVVINDNLEVAKVEARALVEDFLAD